MLKRAIGSLQVSEIGIGCNNFGSRIDEAQTAVVIDTAIEAGINFFDTADNYGKSLSEQFMGRILTGRRDQVIIATKFGGSFDGQETGAHPDHVRAACEASLKRLNTDYIDLYQLHVPDPKVPIADTLGALDELVKAGKVREIGCSNFDSAQLQEAEKAAKGAKFVSVQNHYSLFHREPEPDVLNECVRQNLGFLPYFPLASGLLSGKYRLGASMPEGTRIKSDSDKLSEANLQKVEKLIAYAEGKGHTILELAISWLLAKRPVASVIAGATKPEQVKANAAAGAWRMTGEEVAEIAALVE